MCQSMKINNPQLEGLIAPEKLSGESKIIRLEKEDARSGIVLNDIDEFVHALYVYDGKSVSGSSDTSSKLLNDIGKSHGAYAVGLALHASALNSHNGLVDRIAKQASEKLNANKRFSMDFDYDATGTVFFKTCITGKKIDNKYVLGINAAYVGDKPEIALAEKLGKPRALLRCNVNGVLSIVDDWWFNVDVQDVLKDLKLSAETKDFEDFLLYTHHGGYNGRDLSFDFKHNDRDFHFGLSLEYNSYLKPTNVRTKATSHGSLRPYERINGTKFIGPAWKIYEGQNVIDPTPENPSVVLSVCLPNPQGFYVPVASPENIKAVQEARDFWHRMLEVSTGLKA